MERIPPGWGFVDGSSMGLARWADGLPILPEGPWIPEKRVQVILALVEQPEVTEKLRASDLCRRYESLPINRAAEMLHYARAGHVPARRRRRAA